MEEHSEGSAPLLFLLNNIFYSSKKYQNAASLVCEQFAFDYSFKTWLMKFQVVAETLTLLQQYVSLQLVGLLLFFIRLQTITHLSTNCVLHFPH